MEEDLTQEVTQQEEVKEIDYKDLYIHILADYKNLQRRSLEEKGAIAKRASYDMLKRILPLYNDIVRALEMTDYTDDGLHHIYSKFEKFLAENNITVIDLKFFADNTNSQFDDRYAEAVGIIPLIEYKKENDVKVVDCGFMNSATKEVISYAKVLIYKEN